MDTKSPDGEQGESRQVLSQTRQSQDKMWAKGWEQAVNASQHILGFGSKEWSGKIQIGKDKWFQN